ncbi:MAG: UDP-2,4-diacetamido-2,4,6-trideoxy-beta-L-altropyranose hydrolase, partial [Telluria sp.]
ASCYRLMVIDDLADRWHDCDLLLDQNLGRAEADYSALLPPRTLACIGPQYALLRPEFGQLRAASLARRAQPELRRMLITLGGVDKGNVTGRVLAALRSCRLPADLAVTVVMGPHAPWLAQVQAQAAAMPWPTQVLAGVANMAQLMAESDLAIGAAGSTSWERCCLGLPAIQLVLADNQAEAAAALSALGAVASIGSAAGLADELAVLLMQLDGPRLQQLSQRAALVCDGRGTPGIAAELLKMLDHHEENL